MAISLKQIIEGIIEDLCNDEPSKHIATKLQVASRLLDNKQFSNWVNCEFLNGYEDASNMPEERIFLATDIIGTFTNIVRTYTNAPVPILNLGNDIAISIMKITVTEPLPAIEEIISSSDSGSVNLALNMIDKIYVQKALPNCEILQVSKLVSTSHFETIARNAKSKLIDILMDFNNSIFDNELDFNVGTKKEDIQKVVTNHIYASNVNMGDGSINASNSNNIGGSNNATTINQDSKDQLTSIVDQIEILSQNIDCDRDDIAEAIVEIRQELDKSDSKPKLLKTLFNGIKGCMVNVIHTEVGQMIKDFVDKGVESINNM